MVKGLAVVCEVTGTTLSGPAKTFLLGQLEKYPCEEVLRGLTRCAHECRGKLSLAEVVKAIEFVDRKALSDARAARSAYLTMLRGCALIARVEWNAKDPESVRRALEAKGYHFKEQEKPEPKRLPHWTEEAE